MQVTKKDFKEFTNLVTTQFKKIDQRFEQIDQRFERIDQRFEKMDERFDKLENRMSVGFTYLDEKIDAVDKRLSRKIDTVEINLMKVISNNAITKQEFSDLESRVNILENTSV